MAKVLVIDDEAQIRRFLRAGFELHGFTVVEAENAAAGLKAFEEQRFDAAIVDIFLSDASGFDVIAAMRSDAQSIMPDCFLDVLAKTERPFLTPIYDFAAPRLVFGRVALIGDAAANSRPHMGFGVAKAGEDAKALASALQAQEGDVDKGLAELEKPASVMIDDLLWWTTALKKARKG